MFGLGLNNNMPTYLASTAITVAATGIILTIASLKSLHQGYRPAKFFLIAFSMLILGGLTLVLKNVGLLPAFFLTTYAMQISSAMEIVLLSLAMGDKIRGVQLENQKEIDSLNKDLKKFINQYKHLDTKVTIKGARSYKMEDIVAYLSLSFENTNK